MSSLLMMEWSAKWDWENLGMFTSKAVEISKKVQPVEGEGGAEVGFLHSSGRGGGNCGSCSDLGPGSSSRSSISASVDSSSKEGMKISKFTVEAFEGFPQDFSKKKEMAGAESTGTYQMLEASVTSGEPLIGLKLGKRTYFEDVCPGSNAKTASSSAIPMSSDVTAKRARSTSQAMLAPRCQVEGCNFDLSSAKDYHRKHRVCESHTKSPKVIVGGLERRFCQQCSRFHSLSEFDEKKRSCRRRLSDHNARRRKPQPEAIQFNSAKLSSSVYDERQQMGLVLNRVPLFHTRTSSNPIWESTCGSKFMQTKGYLLKPAKAGCIDEQLPFPSNDLSTSITMLSCDPNRLFPSKSATAEVLNQGFVESMNSSNLDATHDLHRALSLLSKDSWSSCEPAPVSLHSMHVNHSSMPLPAVHAVPQGLPLASSGHWQTPQQSTDSQGHILTSHCNSSHFQEFQLFKAPYESGFYSDEMN